MTSRGTLRGSRRAAVAVGLVGLTLVLLIVALVVLRGSGDDPAPERRDTRRSSPALDGGPVGARGDLTVVSETTIVEDGVVIENARMRGQVTIEGDNVTLRNVRVDSGDFYGVLVQGTGARLEDVTVVGRPGRTLAGVAADQGGGFEASRIEVSGTEDGVRLGDASVLEDSIVHRLAGGPDSHYDAVTADGARGWRISRNLILNQEEQTGAVWLGDPRYAPSEGVLEDNVLAGGGWTVYAGPGTGSGIVVRGNRFSTRYFADSGRFGPVTNWVDEGNTWEGNTWADGPRKGEAVPPTPPS